MANHSKIRQDMEEGNVSVPVSLADAADVDAQQGRRCPCTGTWC